MRSEQCILNDMSIFSTINTMIRSSPAYSRKKNDMSIYQNIASLLIPYILVLLLPYFCSWSILIPSLNVGRPLKEVTTRVKKQYPSVQLSAWMVCVFLSEMILVFWVPLWTLPKSYWYVQFWPIVGWINHQYMPLQFRVIFHSVVACCW